MKLATMLKTMALIALTLAVLPAMSLADKITVIGIVTDANGDTVPGANVTLIDDSFYALGSTTTDANGNFAFKSLETSGSSLVKALVTYARDGHNYSTRPENIRWSDASQGLLNIDMNDTRLYDYPPSDHGYVWGIVVDSPGNGKALKSIVYMENRTATVSVPTGDSTGHIGSFMLEAATGEYEIYAIHDEGSYRLASNRTSITIFPAYDYTVSAPITLVADQRLPAGQATVVPAVTPVAEDQKTPSATPAAVDHEAQSKPVTLIPLVTAFALGIIMIVVGRALLIQK